jgi:hypothetical protein
MTLLTYARAFATLAASVEFTRGRLSMMVVLGQDVLLRDTDTEGMSVLDTLNGIDHLCGNIPSLNGVCHDVERVRGKLTSGVLPIVMASDLEHLQHRVLNELRDHFYYPVTADFTALYGNPRPFGDVVFENFPSARFDICEAGKCLALGQNTATVFHLMRVMEVALKVFGRRFAIPYAPSWEAYLNQIQAKLDAKRPTKPISWLRREREYREIYGDLLAVKIVWRNSTMHIDRNYDAVEAGEIYSAVARFMGRLTQAKFKETGSPVSKAMAAAYQPAP